MPDTFLEAGQHGFLVAGIDIDDPVWTETDLSQSRREQVLPGDAPENFALGPRGDAGREQGGRGAIDRGVAAAGHLMQRPERQTSAGKSVIYGSDPKRQDRAGAQMCTFEALDLLAKAPYGGRLDNDTHALKNLLLEVLFMIRSYGRWRESIWKKALPGRFNALRAQKSL